MNTKLNQLATKAQVAWDWLLGFVSRIGAAIMSARGLSVAALMGCGLLAISPWLRPAISRDFRAVHIPSTDFSTASFLPEFVAEVPRPWRLDSVAIPLVAVILAGIVVVIWRPQWTSRVFGVLLALSIPAVAAALWNHPGLIEFMDSEIRDRSMLRVIYRQRNDDTMTNLAPDRLRMLGEKYNREAIAAPSHPMVLPFRFSMYGPWLIVATFFGVVVLQPGSWPRRLAYAGAWAGAGILLAAFVTGPRWGAEYHWAQAEAAENANDLAAAEASLDRAIAVMPRMALTSRYWLTKGRLAFRKKETNAYASYFLAHQYVGQNQFTRARAEIEHVMRDGGGTTTERMLLAEILGNMAAQYNLHAKYGAAEVCWAEAAEVVPWKPAYWIGESVTIIASDPRRAVEVEQRMLPRVNQVGDCFVASDFSSMLGDAYFAAGEFHDARDKYTAAMHLFHLPKYVNLHAQEGRLGM